MRVIIYSMKQSEQKFTQFLHKNKKIRPILYCAVLIILFLILFGLSAIQSHAPIAKPAPKQSQEASKAPKSLKNQHESDIAYRGNKPNIYVFWGDGCPHCHDLGAFLDQLESKTRSKFNLYTFEVWGDETNSKLQDEFAAALDDSESSGVPYILIGNKFINGYGDSKESELRAAIQHLIEHPDEDAYQKVLQRRAASK